jgi:hypothetical protein
MWPHPQPGKRWLTSRASLYSPSRYFPARLRRFRTRPLP